jgi:hypothetical protein
MAALVGVAPNLRAVLAAHVAFQFVNRRCLGSAHDVQRYGLMRVTAKAADLKGRDILRLVRRRGWERAEPVL